MPPKCPPEIRPYDRVIGATGFCLNRVGLVVRVEGQGLARRFFVHWDDHPAKEPPHALARRSLLHYEAGMVLTLRKRHDKIRKRKSHKDGGSSGSEAGIGGDDMQSDEEIHVEGGSGGGGPIDRIIRRGDESEGERSDGLAEAAAAAAAAAAASNEKYVVLMEPSPSCLPAWSSGSLEQQNITSFGSLQEEIAGLSFKLIEWDERARASQEKLVKNASQLSMHEAASSKAALPDDRAFHLEAAVQKRADIEHARRVAAARAPVRSLMRDEQAAVKLELRFAEEMTLQCVPLPIGRRFFCPIVKCCTHMTFGFASVDSLRTHVALAHGTSLEAYAAEHGWDHVALLHSLGSLINHAVAASTPAQAMRAQSLVSVPGSAMDAIMLERRRRGICLLIEHMNEHARDRAERRVCRHRLRQQRADRLAGAVCLCERWAASKPHTPVIITLLSDALAIANSPHEVRENILLRSGCFPHIRLSLEAGTEAQQQLALALVRALCTSRHNRRELRRAGIIPPLVMLLLPSVAVQQQAGAAAALLALVQGDRVNISANPNANATKAWNVTNLKVLADHPNAVVRLEAVASGGKTASNLLGSSLKGSISNSAVGGYSDNSKQEGASFVAQTAVVEPRLAAGAASNDAVSEHAVSGSADSCDMETGASVPDVDATHSSVGPASVPVTLKKERVDNAAASSAAAAFAAADAAAILSLIRFTLPQAIASRKNCGGVIYSDPDAVAPPPPGESSGASHSSSDGTKQRRSASLQEAKRMLADVVSQSRATAALGGCSGAAGPSSYLPSYSRAYDLSLSVTKWGQSSGDGADKQEEVKRQKRELMRAAREAAREASAAAAAAAAAAASVAAAAAEIALDVSGISGGSRTEGNKGRSGSGAGDGLGREERKRKREATGSTGMRSEGGVGHVKKEDAGAGLGMGDGGSDDDVKVIARGGEAAYNTSHQRGGTDEVELRFVDLSEEKAAALDAQSAVKIDGLVMWEALAGASQSLLQHRKSGYFLEPVDPVALGLNDYCDVVKEPSDLGTVCSRVQRQGFATLQQWVRDIDLIWANALLYNPTDHLVHKDADQMRQYWRSVTLKRVAKAIPFPVAGCVSNSDSRHRVLMNWSTRVELEVGTSTKEECDDIS